MCKYAQVIRSCFSDSVFFSENYKRFTLKFNVIQTNLKKNIQNFCSNNKRNCTSSRRTALQRLKCFFPLVCFIYFQLINKHAREKNNMFRTERRREKTRVAETMTRRVENIVGDSKYSVQICRFGKSQQQRDVCSFNSFRKIAISQTART